MVVYNSGAYGMPPWGTGNVDPRMMSQQQWGMNMMGPGNDANIF